MTGIDALLARCEAAGVEVSCKAQAVGTAALGAGRGAVVVAPHGVWHWLVETTVQD